MNVWATAIWFTIGYAIVAALIAFCTLEQILEKLTILKLLLLMGTAVGGYLILLILYCTGARMFYKRKHNLAKQHVKKYYRDLSRLEKDKHEGEKNNMSTLLVWKDQIEKIYARYSFYIVKILQFVLGLCVFGLINSNIGFMKALSSTVCTVGLAAVTAFLPVGMLALVAALLVLVHLYALSLPVAGLLSGNFSGDVYFLCKIYT